MSGISYGIAGFGQALGQRLKVDEVITRYTSNVEKVMGWGYEYFYAAPSDVSQTDLAVKAAEEALRQADMQGEELDFIVLATSEIPEYLYWDPACELQHRLGAYRAEVQLINQACASGLMAFDAIAGKLAVHPDYKNALVVSVNRICEEYRNRATYNACLHSDGAAAAVVKRAHPRCRLISTQVISDGKYAPLFRLDWGGSAAPFNADNLQLLKEASPLANVQQFFDSDFDKLMEFVQLLNNRNREVAERACHEAGIGLSDVRRVIYLHDNIKSMKEVADSFSIPLERTNVELSIQYGHMGAADQLFGLKQYVEAGDLRQGDYVLLVAIGSGMHWVSTLIEV